MTSVRKFVWNTLVLVMLVWNQYDINVRLIPYHIRTSVFHTSFLTEVTLACVAPGLVNQDL